MKTSALVAAALVSLTLFACDGARKGRDGGTLSPTEAAQARRHLVTWFECGECDEGELQAVVNLGATVIPSLTATLANGPSNANIERMRIHLGESRERLQVYWRTHGGPEPSPPEQFTQTFLGNYKARYQVRAAQALAAIGGTEARRALEAALALDLRDDVREAVLESLGRDPGQRPNAARQ